MQTVTVKFASTNQPYVYLTDIEGVEAGDTLVVDSPNSSFTCVTVISVHETAESVEKATKWIVSKVDVTGYKARLEKVERRKLLTAKLKKMQEEALEADQFSALIKLVPGAAALVDELKSLA
jgi:hypothetical protein